jgi:Holliday junction resolvase RusA-like endonuclease
MDNILGTQSLRIKEKLPGLNDIIRWSKSRNGKWSRMGIEKERIELSIQYEIQKQEIRPVKVAAFRFHWLEENRRRDPDNIMAGQKFILDALVKSGVLENDGQRQVYSIEHTFGVDKARPGCLVNIDEVAEP